MGKSYKTKSSKKRDVKPHKEEPQEFDLKSFVQSEALDLDKDVAALLEQESVPNSLSTNALSKKSKKKSKENKQEEEENVEQEQEDVNSEDEREMQAYIEMMNSKEEKVEEEPEFTEKIYPNRTAAILERLEDIKTSTQFPWIDTQVITYNEETQTLIEDINDDLKRELAFYQQALHGATEGKIKVVEAGVLFSRPKDYYAEMVKTDAQMTRIRQRLLDEATSIKASEEARKQRELKKFGKKVQQEKIMERERSKKAELEKIKLARKKGQSRANAEGADDDEFNVSASAEEPQRRTQSQKQSRPGDGKGKKRKYKDEKFGFGGPRKFKKSNTAESTNDMDGFNPKKMKFGGRGGSSRGRGGFSARGKSRGGRR